jgi:hypothetical protein
MSFTWVETITAKVTKVKLSHLTELRVNINTDRSNTGLGAYSWATTPTVGSKILASHFLELRTALDASYDNNYCHTYQSGYLSAQNASNLTAEHSNNYAYCSGNYAYYSSHNGAWYSKGKL